MTTNRTLWAEVDEQGRLVLPTHVTARLGVKPGERMRLEEDTSQIRLHQPTGHLAKVYLEPTNRCNITCRTCMRNTWDEPLVRMSDRVFERVLGGCALFHRRPSSFLEGSENHSPIRAPSTWSGGSKSSVVWWNLLPMALC